MPFSLLCRINYVGLLVSSQKGCTFVLSENESQISATPLCFQHITLRTEDPSVFKAGPSRPDSQKRFDCLGKPMEHNEEN